MKNEEKIKCLNELSRLITANNLKFDDIKVISEKFFSKHVDLLHIGKIEIVAKVPESIYNRDLIEKRIVPYFGNDVSDEFIKKENEVTNTNKGSLDILIYPIKNYHFEDDEVDFIHCIISLFYLSFTKKRLEDLIEETRYKDSLTNALNVEGLNKFFHNIKKSDKYVYIFSNIKNFKYINTIFDRKNSDYILRQYTKELLLIMDNDEVLCRPGGDNFISIIKLENFEKYLKKLQCVTMNFDGNKIYLYSTIGYYENIDSLSPNNAMEFSSSAYSMARRKNVSIFKYTNELNQKIIKEKTIKVEIMNALKNGEFVNFYQPKVNSDINELCGAEALVRWNKNGKLVLPNEFIEVLEKENSIIDLDYYVLTRVCKDIKIWQSLGLEPVKISVNFSMKHLDDNNVVNKIIEIIKQFNVEPKYIEIELTELTNIENISKMNGFINSLHKNDISVSMDDFGSGYSSVTLLKNLNYDMVKIDKGLIDSIENDNKKNLIILRNIIKMLKELKINVIAEGVESKKQLDILNKYGCKIIQGYYYDKPLQMEDFVKKLEIRKYKK